MQSDFKKQQAPHLLTLDTQDLSELEGRAPHPAQGLDEFLGIVPRSQRAAFVVDQPGSAL